LSKTGIAGEREERMKISKKDILAASGCALLLPGGLGLSYFVFGYGLKGCVIAVFLSLFAAVSVLAAYIWQSQKSEEGKQ